MRGIALLGLVACGSAGEDGSAAVETDDPPGVPSLCDPVAPPCTSGCAPAPSDIDHGPWSSWLTASPEITWTAASGAKTYELAVGSAPGLDDIQCWIDVGDLTAYTFQALWGVVDGGTYYPSIRAIDATGHPSEARTTDGWVVDIQPPEMPTAVEDGSAPVTGEVSWEHPGTDNLSGFEGYEIAVGTAPGLDDALPWTPVASEPFATLPDPLPQEAWYWLSVRATDIAGNASPPATSEGFIACPDHFAFIPSNADVGSTPFCVARYEMRILGEDDGNRAFDAGFVAESRGTGTPWTQLDKGQARVACDALGFSYQLITNPQWQAIARSIENEPSNWSGGAVGSGSVNRGHSDEVPFATLSGDTDPCEGTGNPSCEDNGSEDFAQKRTHHLGNGELLWDFAGNAWEQVDGSTGSPPNLWMEFTDGVFTTEPGWEDYRASFGPEGPYDGSHGMGGFYGGSGNLIRGGSYDFPNPGTAGAQGYEDMGIYAGHHNAWAVEASHGFRCAYTPM